MTDTIDARLGLLEAYTKSNPAFADTKAAVDACKLEHLLQLRELRDSLQGGEGGSSKELEALRRENEQLKKNMKKRDYRITILLKSLAEEEAKNK